MISPIVVQLRPMPACQPQLALHPVHARRREDLENMQKAIIGIDAIFEAEKLEVPQDAVAAEIQEALAEAQAAGQELDRERLEEQAAEVVKVSQIPLYAVCLSYSGCNDCGGPAERVCVVLLCSKQTRLVHRILA